MYSRPPLPHTPTMAKETRRFREKLYITISPALKKKARAVANALDVSVSTLIETSLRYYLEKKFDLKSEPSLEEIQREIRLLEEASPPKKKP